jgi:hypothetical protein
MITEQMYEKVKGSGLAPTSRNLKWQSMQWQVVYQLFILPTCRRCSTQ